MRIVQLSDTHISHLGGTPSYNMSLAVDYINNELNPDLVINTGDVVVLNPDSVEDRETAWRLHANLEAPLLVLPGNHDVGEAGPNPWMGLGVTSDRVAGFRRRWGPDRFLELGQHGSGSEDWAFIGINSELLSSGLPEEAEQWEWLGEVAEQVRGKSVMLFLHRPLWFLGSSEPGLTIGEKARDKVVAALAPTRLRVVANGHLHRSRNGFEGEVLSVWAPSLTFVAPSDPQYGLERTQSGIVEYHIEGDTVEATFHQVPGLSRVEDVLSMPEVIAAMAEIEAASLAQAMLAHADRRCSPDRKAR